MTSESTHAGQSKRRSGRKGRGREARLASRRAGTTGNVVQPGMQGGTFKPLSDRDISRIHTAALDVLERIGIGDPIPEILDVALPKGCTLGDDGRLRFPRALIEDVIAGSAKSYISHAPDPSREHIHSFGQPFIASEWSHDVYVHDMNIAYAALAGTQKAFALGIAVADHIEPLIDLFDTYLGREGAFLERPFCQFGGCPIVSPLRFGKENAEVLVKVAQLGLVGDVAVAAQAGATAPAPLAGALVQTFAETLACLAVVNLIRPGNPMNFGMWPFISDLRTGSFSGGSGEEALAIAATTQLINHYGLISSVPSGMTDSKTMDAQAGYEKGITTLAAVLAGGNMVSVYPGIVGSLIAQSFEGMMIDNDMMGMALRVVRGIEVTDETLALEDIERAVKGEGHFLGHPQTLALMQSEYLYPEVGDRRSPNEWEASGSENIYEIAHEKVKDILSSHYPEYIDPKADAAIREKFPIKLAPADMKPGNGRWVV